MLRFLAGAVSALLFIAAGCVIWIGSAEADDPIPPAPTAPPLLMAPLPQKPVIPPAAPEKSREEKRFARYDDNDDGIITRAEMMNSRRTRWENLDTNGDNRLDFEEWAISTSEKFAEADADGSRTLNAAEFLTTRRKSKPKPKPKCEC
jgi:hypothetical protein